MVAAGAIVAAGLTAVSALPASAAVACTIDYKVTNQWNTGFQGDVTIHNLGDAVSTWNLKWTWPGSQSITQSWNSSYTQSGTAVTLTNAAWNGSIASGGTLSGIGFLANYSGTNTNPTAFTLNGTACTGATTNQPPTVSITAPTANQHFTAPANITINATAADADGTIAKVEFYHDGLLINTDTSAPYSFVWSGVPSQAAAYHVQALAYDNTGATSQLADVPVFVDAVATPSIVASATSVNVPQNGTATYTVALSAQPTASVTVATSRTAGDTGISVTGGASLTFTTSNWNTGQTVTLTGSSAAPSGTATITSSATGYTSAAVTATKTVVTTPSIVASASSLNVPQNGTGTYTVKLSAQPTASVTVTTARTAGDTGISVTGGASLTFTTSNWNTGQTVTLTGSSAAPSGTATITSSATGYTSAAVTATKTVVATPSINTTVGLLNVPQSGTATFGVTLSAAPTANVTVTVARTAGDTGVSVTGGASLTFTSANWNTAQTVTLTGDSTAPNGTATITASATGYTSATVTATKVASTTNQYTLNFLTQYNKLKDPKNGYFSPDGVPYHSIETLVVEAPDWGHETTSEAFSYWIWLEAEYGRQSGVWDNFNNAWNTMEKFIIPTHANQTTTNYNPSSPATYAAEAPQPSLYPTVGGHLDSSVTAGQDPLYNELVSTYGNSDVYGMHWIIDTDNVYGYSSCTPSGSKVSYINTYQRGPQESVWETVAQPSCETFQYGAKANGGYLPLFIDGTYAQQWRYTDAPDADARAIQAAYWALTWATAQGKSSSVSATVAKAAKMGDFLRYAMYDKYFKNPGCTSTSCAAGSGKSSSNYLLSWYYAWGGAIGGGWSWRIGASHNHQGYQNPLAAWALANVSSLKPLSPTASADWATSLQRQIQFYTWLQSNEGAFAGGATNSWGGNYSAPPSGTPTFYGLAYDFEPVYHDPASNQWFGFQAWSVERVAEYYYVTGDAAAKALLDKWVSWAIANTTVGTNGAFSIPSTLSWSGQPGGNWTSSTTSVNNSGLHVSVVDSSQDIGVAAAYAKLLTYYAAKSGNASAKTTAKGLLDAIWAHQDTQGVGIPEQRKDYNRFDDIWAAGSDANQQGLYIPSSFNGVMPNGDVIAAGKSFLDIRSFYKNDPNWPAVQTYLNLCKTSPTTCESSAPSFTFHRFWAESDIAMAMADFGALFPNG
jgi:hypothetical protein